MTLYSLICRLRYVLLVLLAVLWAGAFTLTHLPPANVPNFHASDKTLHLVGFAGLASAFGMTLLAFGVPRRRRLILLFTVMLAYGAVDELTQPLAGRTADIEDWLFDAAGTFIAAGLVEAIALIVGERKKPIASSQ